ncbi:MAG: gluconate 2-dehydrogenase subunit 3 family protein [Chitinophagaceae bacterium]
MNRRELLRMIAIATGGVVIGGEFLLSGCKNPDSGPDLVFSPDDLAFLDEVAETILPKTDTPGAKDAHVGGFMITMVNDCYTAKDQQEFHSGLKKIDEACRKMHDTGFMKATPQQRQSLLISLDKEAGAYRTKKNQFDSEQVKREKEEHEKGNTGYKREEMTNHYFSMIKQLTIFGFFTSKEGRQGALRYLPVPGKFTGVIDYQKGDKLFAGLT